MKSTYKVLWSDHSLIELKETIEYLELNWSEKEITRLVNEIERTLNLISNNPYLFPQSKNTRVHRVVILKLNSIYYRVVNDETVEVLSFFSNRQNPESLQS